MLVAAHARESAQNLPDLNAQEQNLIGEAPTTEIRDDLSSARRNIDGLQLPEDYVIPRYAESYMQSGYVRLLWRDKSGRKRWKALHRDIWEWAYGPIPDGHVVHHVDGNHLDDSLQNLQCLSRADHSRLHREHPELASPEGAKLYAKCRETIRRASRAAYRRRKERKARTAQSDSPIAIRDQEQVRLGREVRETMAKMKASRQSTDAKADSGLPRALNPNGNVAPTEILLDDYKGKENDMSKDTNPPTEAAPPCIKPSAAETIAMVEAFLAEHCPEKAGPFPPRMPIKRGRKRKSKTVASVWDGKSTG